MSELIKKITAVDVYLQRRKTRTYVGRLSRAREKFIFVYHSAYIYKRQSISLGPDLALSEKKYISKELFPSFEDRIPSRRNPAYPEYCQMVGIDPEENDLMTLVATLGHKGPSSFIFVPAYEKVFGADDVIHYRKLLGLTVREFSKFFDFSPATIHRLEKNKTSGKDALKRLEIYYQFPEVALYEAKKNRFKISDKKSELALKILMQMHGHKSPLPNSC